MNRYSSDSTTDLFLPLKPCVEIWVWRTKCSRFHSLLTKSFNSSEYPLFQHLQKICSIAVVLHQRGCLLDLLGADVPVTVGDLLRTGHHESLTCFDGLDEQRSFEHCLVRAGIEPGHAPAHNDHFEHAAVQILAID